jgi:hypothetical protein
MGGRVAMRGMRCNAALIQPLRNDAENPVTTTNHPYVQFEQSGGIAPSNADFLQRSRGRTTVRKYSAA